MLDELVISFEFQEPFEEDKQAKWTFIGAAYRDGIISLKTAVRLLEITDKPDKEVEQILKELSEKAKTGHVENLKIGEKEYIRLLSQKKHEGYNSNTGKTEHYAAILRSCRCFFVLYL